MSADRRLQSAAKEKSSLRLDSFLSEVRLIKRRTQAKTACEEGVILLDGKVAKPGKEVKAGQIIIINFANRILEVEVVGIPSGNVRKAEAKDFYRVIREEKRKEELL
jgi:ribosomal 50S subunit-recycling heat shock protein